MKDTLPMDVENKLRPPLQTILDFPEGSKGNESPESVQTDQALAIQTAPEARLSTEKHHLDSAGVEGAPDFSPTDVCALAKICQSLVAPRARKKHLVSNVVINADVPPVLLLDGLMIRQVLVTLLDNAVTFTESGSVTLHLAWQPGSIRFSVTDTGIRISEKDIATLFGLADQEPRLDVGHRAGLDLALVRQVVERMDGTMGASSTTEHGTRFWFEIAAREAVLSTADESAPACQGDGPGGARILIADDLDLNRKLIADMLSIDGHDIDCVSDGAAAVQAASQHDYDLILMDMIMPVMDGIQATRAIRALPAPACDVAIIALTAHSFKEQLDSCLAAGMDATITKPMSLDTLTSMVRNWTSGKTRAA